MKKSRADYFKKRREKFKQFNVMVEKEKIKVFEEILEKQNITKTCWLNSKIDEEIEKNN